MTLAQTIKSRRSVRRFTTAPVPRETISKLLELATWAPHAGEAWRFVVVQESERRRRPLKEVVSWETSEGRSVQNPR